MNPIEIEVPAQSFRIDDRLMADQFGYSLNAAIISFSKEVMFRVPSSRRPGELDNIALAGITNLLSEVARCPLQTMALWNAIGSG